MAARDLREEKQGIMEQTPQATPPPPAMNSIQIVLDQAMQERIVDIVMDDWEASKTARNSIDYGSDSKGGNLGFDEWLKRLRDLYNGKREPKETPWKFCSNRGLKIAASILDMIHSRLYPAIVNDDLLTWRPGEATDQPKVERVSKLMHWWIWVNSKMRQFFDVWVKMVAGYGDGLTESYWNVRYVDRGDVNEEPVVDEMGQPIMNPDGTPAVLRSKMPHAIETSASKVYPKEDVFLQENSTDIRTEPVILRDDFKYRELEHGEIQGKFTNVVTVLKDMLNYTMPDTTGMDAGQEQRLRDVKVRNVPVEVLKWYGHFDVDGDGFDEDVRITIVPEHRLYIGGVLVKDLTKSGERPLNFTKFDNRIEKAEQNNGEGVLEKIREMSDEIDAIFNQLTDSNTISILRPFFYDPGGDVDAPALKLAPNKGIAVSDPQRNVFFPDIRIQTDQLMNAIRLVLEFIERLTAASSYVMGKESEIVGGSGTATRTNAIMNSAEQRFAIPSERLRDGASQIIRTHLDLLQLNIPPELENRVLGEDGMPIFHQNELTDEGISGQYDAYLLEDPSLGNKDTERQLSSMLYSVLMQNVIVGSDPAKIYRVTADLLKAYGKDPEPYLGPEPDSDMIDSPEDENTLIVQGDFARVNAQITENHLLHIQKHMELLQSPNLAKLPPEMLMQITNFTQQHVQQHMQMMQVMMALVKKFGGGGGDSQQLGGENGSSNGEGSTSGTTPGSGNPSSMETVPGPLGAAMQDKRQGEVAGPA